MKIGDKIVCVNDLWCEKWINDKITKIIFKNKTYTIKEIEDVGTPHFLLNEIEYYRWSKDRFITLKDARLKKIIEIQNEYWG